MVTQISRKQFAEICGTATLNGLNEQWWIVLRNAVERYVDNELPIKQVDCYGEYKRDDATEYVDLQFRLNDEELAFVLRMQQINPGIEPAVVTEAIVYEAIASFMKESGPALAKAFKDAYSMS